MWTEDIPQRPYFLLFDISEVVNPGRERARLLSARVSFPKSIGCRGILSERAVSTGATAAHPQWDPLAVTAAVAA